MTTKRKTQLREYAVPMRWTQRGFATVTAHSPEDARAAAEALQVKLPSGVQAETVDWDIVGEPVDVGPA